MRGQGKMAETKNKRTKVKRSIKLVIIGFLLLCLLWCLVSNIFTWYEKKNNKPIGKIVKVDQNDMHLYIKGKGKETIVLLSGLGTIAPALDFMPLTDKLSKNYRVVVVENFGYGWSKTTKKERTVDNIVEETRVALKEAGVKGPYILMPHSISGIYTMYYVNKYPEEVKAIVGIDISLPNQVEYFEGTYPKASKALSFLAPTGVSRLVLSFASESFLPKSDESTYSEDVLKQIKMIAGWNGYNKNVISEINYIEENSNKTKDMYYPKELPVLIFTREPKHQREDSKTKASFYSTYLDKLNKSDLILLDGNHYLHWTESETIYKYTHHFINKNID